MYVHFIVCMYSKMGQYGVNIAKGKIFVYVQKGLKESLRTYVLV